MGNTCFIHALADGNPEIGNIRETFFYCAICVNHKVTSSPAADFLVKGHTFEVGGKSKRQKQIKNVNNAFVVKDDIENAYMNVRHKKEPLQHQEPVWRGRLITLT